MKHFSQSARSDLAAFACQHGAFSALSVSKGLHMRKLTC